jgi:hypothetical protein
MPKMERVTETRTLLLTTRISRPYSPSRATECPSDPDPLIV